jgi:hypothetical protein
MSPDRDTARDLFVGLGVKLIRLAVGASASNADTLLRRAEVYSDCVEYLSEQQACGAYLFVQGNGVGIA